MASDLRGWETDPLFAAAEVVQDSADRMETMYRLVLHESSFIKGDHPDSIVLSSLKLHRRDLLTAVETTKWQLEDFEKAASLLIVRSKMQAREVIAARYKHFVEAIREQIRQIEKNLDYSSLRDSVIDTFHANSNTQDEDSLEFFLSGVMVNPMDHARHNGKVTKDCSIFEGFLDAAGASCSVDGTNEIVEEDTEDTGNSSIKRDPNCIYGTSKFDQITIAKNDDWDLEACTSNSEIVKRKKVKELIVRISIFFNFIGSYLSSYGSWISRNYARKLKDEEHTHSSLLNVLHHTKSHNDHGRRWTASALIRFQVLYSQLTTRMIHSSNHRYAFMKRRPIQSVMIMIFAAIFLEFTYQGIKGPENWAALRANYTACASGQFQPHINIITSQTTPNASLQPISPSYQATAAVLVNSKFNVEVIFNEDGGALTVNDKEDHNLEQFHLHVPSEHQFTGQQEVTTLSCDFAAELHIVHEASDGSFAVLAIMYELGHNDTFISQLEGGLKSITDDPTAEVSVGSIEVLTLLPSVDSFYRYSGSLTTPPCSEGVTWTVLSQAKTISAEQVAAIKAALAEDNKNNFSL